LSKQRLEKGKENIKSKKNYKNLNLYIDLILISFLYIITLERVSSNIVGMTAPFLFMAGGPDFCIVEIL
jgi:hypothetical protein